MEAAKALGGSFKLVTLAPKTVREMTTAKGNIKGWGHTNQKAQMNIGTDRQQTDAYDFLFWTVSTIL